MSMGTLVLAWVLAADPASGDVYYINQHQIRIPISVDPARRAEIKELHLFVSGDEGKTWHEQAVAAPDQEAFSFYAPKDGMYWFSVSVINQQNKREPQDIYAAPPSQKIVIDTLKPMLRIKAAERQGDEAVVSWEIQEDHPDLATLKLEYRSPEAGSSPWVAVPVTQVLTGQARFRPVTAGPVVVRLQVQDLAGNFSTADAEIAGGTLLASAPVGPTNPVPVPGSGPQGVATPGTPAGPMAPPLPTPPSQAPPASNWDSPQAGQPVAASRSEQRVPGEATLPGAPISNYQPVNHAAVDAAGSRLVATSEPPAGGSPAVSTSAASRPARGALPALLITNNKQVSIDYEVTKVGPSGIGKVELWMTRDDGKTWEKFAENPELKPPLKVELPGEGVYGFRLVLQSKAGKHQPAPTPQTPPELRLELDTTPPTAQLFRPEPDPKQNDALVLTWSASDRNLAPNPITLQWTEQPGKEWQTIVADGANDGHYTWKLPPNIPYLVYLRLVTHDTAGNTSIAETPEPVCIDLKEPEGRILGIGGNIRRQMNAEASHRPEHPGEPRTGEMPLPLEKNR